MPRKYLFRRKPRYVRKAKKPGMRRRKAPLNGNKVYAFKRLGQTLILQNSTTAGTITTNNAALVSLGTAISDTIGSQFGAGMAFRLANLESSSDFTSLYDQYKIKGVAIKIIPLSDSATANSSGFLPTLYWRTDNDDSAAPANESEMRQAQDVKTMRLTGPRSIYIPYPKSAVDVNGTVSSYGAVANRWINCSETTVFHHGLKMWLKNVDLRAQPNTTTAFRIEVMYYLLFRGPQ